jgi:hypothetical protein
MKYEIYIFFFATVTTSSTTGLSLVRPAWLNETYENYYLRFSGIFNTDQQLSFNSKKIIKKTHPIKCDLPKNLNTSSFKKAMDIIKKHKKSESKYSEFEKVESKVKHIHDEFHITNAKRNNSRKKSILMHFYVQA